MGYHTRRAIPAHERGIEEAVPTRTPQTPFFAKTNSLLAWLSEVTFESSQSVLASALPPATKVSSVKHSFNGVNAGHIIYLLPTVPE
jgi:hypothetical protein